MTLFGTSKNALTRDECLEGVKKLDPAFDAHWTADGLPDLNALKVIIGKRVTHKQIEDVAPGLIREVAAAAASEDPPETDDSGHGIHALNDAFKALTDDEIRNNGPLSQVVTAWKHHFSPMMEHHRRNVVKGRV